MTAAAIETTPELSSPAPHPEIELVYPVVRPQLRDGIVGLKFGYKLFSALLAYLPDLHGNTAWHLFARPSQVHLRIPRADLDRHLLDLEGQILEVGGLRWTLGAPTIFELRPAAALYCPLVTISAHRTHDQERLGWAWLRSVRRQLDEMGVTGRIQLERGRKRFLQIGGANNRSWGHEVRLRGLDDEASLALLRRGLGGRQRFGAGCFVPVEGGHR